MSAFPYPLDKMIEGLSNEEYHAHPALSSSQIRTLLRNPYEYVIGMKPESTPAMDFGTLGHCLVLEPHKFESEFAIIPKVDGRTKEGKAIKEAFEKTAIGKILMNEVDYQTAKECIKSLEKAGLLYFNVGIKEVSFFSNIDGIPVRVKLDNWLPDRKVIFDLKFTEDASADGFAKSSAKYGYYIQDAFYSDIVGADRFVFVAIEKNPPYMIGVYEHNMIDRDFGRAEYKRALNIYKRLDEFQTPLYKDPVNGEIIQTVTLPNYIYYKKGASAV